MKPATIAAIALVVATVGGSAAASASRQQGLFTDHPATNPDGTVNALIEIPAGTTAKFEVSADGRSIEQDLVDGAPRFIEYLAYPANYGMVPRTLEDPATGGDGDPLDVIVLGGAIDRGELVGVRLLGVLRMLDTGERDDKLIAVVPGSPLARASTLAELNTRFPGVTAILETWFSHYKGPGRVEIEGIDNETVARAILDRARAAFENRRNRVEARAAHVEGPRS